MIKYANNKVKYNLPFEYSQFFDDYPYWLLASTCCKWLQASACDNCKYKCIFFHSYVQFLLVQNYEEYFIYLFFMIHSHFKCQPKDIVQRCFFCLLKFACNLFSTKIFHFLGSKMYIFVQISVKLSYLHINLNFLF